MYGTLVFYCDEEIKNVTKNLIQRFKEGKEQPPYVNSLTSLKEGEYRFGMEETETVFAIFYFSNAESFVDMYRFFLHFFPSD